MWRCRLSSTRPSSASRSAAISWSGRMFSTPKNSASGKKSASGNQFVRLSCSSSWVRTLGQMTQSVCGISRARTATRKARADSMTCEKVTGRRPSRSACNWRAIGSASATIFRRSAPDDFSTPCSRRKASEVQFRRFRTPVTIPDRDKPLSPIPRARLLRRRLESA